MNYKMIIHTTGQIIGVGAICLLLSAGVSLVYAEVEGIWLLLSALFSGVLFFISRFFKPKDTVFFAKEGLVTVALSWIILSLIGALPFYLSKEIPDYIDCFFETVSGFSTTGATILSDPQVLSKGNMFWRSLTHWIGGMGVLVLLVALLPSVSGRSIHMLRAEMPGPVVGKLVPKAKQTARILYIIYIVLTLLQFILLLAGGMPVYESAVHTLGTAGTGGFGVYAESIASYSPYLQWVITIFMFLFGINFNLFFFILIKRFKLAFTSQELWTYIGIVLVSTVLIALNISNMYPTFEETLRHSAFQVSSYISTTGYTTVNSNTWPAFSKMILIVLMFIGACAGSTAGGLKVSRIVLIAKSVRNRIFNVVHPRTVKAVRFEGKSVDDATIFSVLSYLAIYVFCFIVLLLILSLDNFNFETNFTAAASTFNNVGPFFGQLSNYADYSVISKIAMSFAMLLGRLEIYPILILFLPATWKK
ncbi:MAG: TrkH family potassium uptake protein [Clostridiales bacterium]|nr:TrkH family potassium uptake protein [Clostridiales bacterium]